MATANDKVPLTADGCTITFRFVPPNAGKAAIGAADIA